MGQPAASAGADLAGDHRRREVPRRDGRAHADRLLHHHQALRSLRRLQYRTVYPLGLFGEPGDERRGVRHFAARFGQRLALLGGHQLRQIFLCGQHLVGPGQQQRGTLLGGQLFPLVLRPLRRRDRLLGFLFADQRNAGQFGAGGRIDHRFALAAQGIAPFAVDQTLAAQ